MKQGFVYIITNKPFGTLYIGVTSNLIQRIYQHKHKLVKGFSSKYELTKLVWYDVFDSMDTAIYREKHMKEWNRNWKLREIMEMNPDWNDLYDTLSV